MSDHSEEPIQPIVHASPLWMIDEEGEEMESFMSEYETLNWIETTIEVRYKDGSTRRIKVKPGENLADAAGEGWISLSIVESPYGAYSHSIITPKISPEAEEISAAGSREGAAVPG